MATRVTHSRITTDALTTLCSRTINTGASGKLHATTNTSDVTCKACLKKIRPATNGLELAAAKKHVKILDTFSSFAAKKRYCDTRFEKLGTGSGRAVYAMGTHVVLKLARNKKGLEQNATEADGSMKSWYGDLLAQSVDACPVDTWVLAERAYPCKSADFQRVFGVPMQEVFQYLQYTFRSVRGSFQPQQPIDILDDNALVNQLVGLIADFDLEVVDLCRKDTWGLVGTKLVLRDYGLNRSIWEEYYRKEF